MIIKAKPLNNFCFKVGGWLVSAFLKKRFNKLLINPIAIKSGHSYLLMCNHFSFLDGPLGYYLCYKTIWQEKKMMKLFIMVLKKQMQKNKWLKYVGCFSVEPGRRSIKESFDFAGRVLSAPGNVLLFFPQGNLESCHIDHIRFQEGLNEVVKLIKGPCQLIWCSNTIEFFESTRPSVYFNMLDCGTTDNFDFAAIQNQVNHFHKAELKKTVRLITMG